MIRTLGAIAPTVYLGAALGLTAWAAPWLAARAIARRTGNRKDQP